MVKWGMVEKREGGTKRSQISRSMKIALAGIAISILSLPISQIAGLSDNGSVVLLICGMVTSVLVALLFSYGRRLSLLHLFIFFLVVSVEVGLFVALAKTEKNLTLFFFVSLLFPVYTSIVGAYFVTKFSRKRQNNEPVEPPSDCN